MSCINKSSASYQILVDAYGDNIAEAAVRKMTSEKGLEDNFYIPSIEEVEDLINPTAVTSTAVKPGVQEVFDTNPELASVGTPEQYATYLDSIFPDSQVKDIVYHGTANKFDKFELGHTDAAGKKSNTQGYHFIAKAGKSWYKEKYGNLLSVVLDIKNAVKDSKYDKALEYLSERDKKVFKAEGYDSGIKYSEDEDGDFEYVVFEPEQIHILGTPQDVEGFRNFVKGTPETKQEILTLPLGVEEEAVKKLESFELFEKEDTLCASGICNYTARTSMEKLKEVGLKPFDVGSTGSGVAVTVKTPLADFNITHYVAPVAINNAVYIYDMPQQEFISSEFFGEGSSVALKTTYKPRLIPLTVDDISINYDIDRQQAAKFVRSVLETAHYLGKEDFIFKDYIKQTVSNSNEYIDSLKKDIESAGVLPEFNWEEEIGKKFREEDTKAEEEVKKVTQGPTTKEQENRVVNFLRNKLLLKTKEFVPRKDDPNRHFKLKDLVKSVIGKVSVSYKMETLEDSLSALKDYMLSPLFRVDMETNYKQSLKLYKSQSQKVDLVFSYLRMFKGLLKNARVKGIDEALRAYDKTQQYKLRSLLDSDIKTKYKSDRQMLFMIQKKFLNPDTLAKSLKVLDFRTEKSFNDLLMNRIKAGKSLQKAETILNYLKLTDNDVEYVYDSIANEAKRKYKYYASTGRAAFQLEGVVEPAVVSPQAIKKVKEFLKRIGVDYTTVQKIVVNGKQFDANAVADFTRKIIEIVEGKEGVALPEEAMHFYVEILKQTNPKLLDSMLAKIAKYPVYKQVFATYSSNPLYQTKDGKPDIRKLKEEAIAKKLADLLILGTENDSLTNNMEISDWWQRVLDWFRELFQKAGFNPFEEAIKGLEYVEEGVAAFISPEGQMFQLPEGEEPAEKRDKYFEKIKNTPLIKTEKGYNTINGKEVTNRVTDFAKRFYDKLFGDRQITQTEQDALINDTIREYGTAGHSDIENILYLFIDKESGFRRAQPLEDKNIPQTSRKVYDALKEHFEERIAGFPAGTRFLLEAKVFDNKDTAGTMDFIAISKEGKLQILDWKFINLNTDNYNDVPWYKKKAWRIQLAQYKRILEQNYDIPSSDIVRTSAIPIKAHYNYSKDIDGTYEAILTGISIGNTNVSTEERDYLLPVSLEQQSTGDDKLDRLIKKIQGLRESLEEESAKTPEERFAKGQQLNLIEQALRHLQEKHSIVPLLDQASEYLKSVTNLFDTYDNVLAEKDFNQVPLKELTDFGLKLNRAFDLIKIYTNLDNELSVMFKGEMTKEREELEEELGNVVREARKLSSNLEELTNKFGEKIANSVGVSNLMDPELQVSLNKRMFVETSRLQMKTLQAFFKKRQEAQNRMDFQTDEENRELLEVVKPKYDELAKRMGWNLKNYFDILTQKGSNKLIDQFQMEFYKEAKQRLKDKDYEWIKENVDVEAYKERLQKNYESQVKYFENKVYSGSAGEQRRKRKRDIDDLKKKYDVSTPESLGWFLHYHTLRGFPLVSKWESQEWKEMNKYPEARALYDWIIKTNEKADEAGYLPDDSSKRVFLPFVAKSFTEKIVFGGKVRLGEEFMRAITIDEEAVGYGQVDKVTNRLVNKIPRYFVTELDRELSQDLFRNLALYNESVNRYKELSDLEGIALALGRVERNKTSIQTSFWGKPNYDISKNQFDIIESNDKNADLYDRQIATLVYGQKYVQSEQFDQLLGKVGSVFNTMNKKLGFNLFPENMAERQLSLNKSIDGLNHFFQTKVLGLNPLSSISNAIGGSLNAMIRAGKYFDKVDFVKSEFEISSNLLQGEYGKKVLAAMKYFVPFTENMNRELLSELSLSKINDETMQNVTFGLMRYADYMVQSSLFLSVLRNQILIDGQIVNAREYLRNQPEYKERYKDITKLEQVESEFEGKLQELLSKHSLLDKIELKGDKITIPGIDRNSADVYKVHNLTKELSKNALGNLSPEEVRGIQQNIFSRSFMVFKNWIPSLVDVRFGELKYNSAEDAYEWGRYRTVARYLGTNSIKSTLNLMAAVRMTPQTVEDLNKLYEKKKKDYYLATGKKLEMTEQEFYDMVRENMRQAGVDAAMSITLLAMFFAAVALKPDPDDDEDKYVTNMHKFAVRALDKISDELTFFYSPGSFQQILNGSIFPSLGVFTDAGNVIGHMLKEFYGMSFDDKMQEKNHVIKYMLKPIPLVSQLSSYLPLYAPDLAKDLGIEISKESRMR